MEEKLSKVVSQRLVRHGLTDPKYVEKAVASLHPRFVVEESFREVAGEQYPLYVASIDVDMGAGFERQALRLINQQVAHRRFATLMGLSFGLAAFLLGIDRLVMGRSGSKASENQSATLPAT